MVTGGVGNHVCRKGNVVVRTTVEGGKLAGAMELIRVANLLEHSAAALEAMTTMGTRHVEVKPAHQSRAPLTTPHPRTMTRTASQSITVSTACQMALPLVPILVITRIIQKLAAVRMMTCHWRSESRRPCRLKSQFGSSWMTNASSED